MFWYVIYLLSVFGSCCCRGGPAGPQTQHIYTADCRLLIWFRQFCASMWTLEESDEIQRIAKETVPGVKTMAIPQGLQVEKGPDAVVEFLKEKWPGLVES